MKRIIVSFKKYSHNLTYLCFLCYLFFATNSLTAQVGINNTDPKASLDITATDPSDPENTDGLLVPRVSVFPTSNPGIDQNGMLLYLTTTVGLNTSGFYYWNQNTTSWLKVTDSSVNSSDADFYEEGTTTAPDDINDDIYTQGNVAIGKTTADYPLEVSHNTAQRGINIVLTGADNNPRFGIYSDITSTGSNGHLGFRNFLTVNGNGNHWGIQTHVSGTGTGGKFGHSASIFGAGTGSHWGTINNLNGTGDGQHVGVYTILQNSGNGEQIGAYNSITNTGSGDHYGSSNVLSGDGNGANYGTSNNLSGSGTGIQYGSYQIISATNSTFQYGNYNEITGINLGQQYGTYNYITGESGAGQYGTYNYLSNDTDENQFGTYSHIIGDGNGNKFGNSFTISNTGSGDHYGNYISLSGSGSGNDYGTYNRIVRDGNGDYFGTYNLISGSASGSGIKIGSYNNISSLTGGTHYGVYSDVTKAGSYAGYFIGNVSIGTTNTNTYIFPAIRGTNNQIMQTDGSGNVDWVDASTLGDHDFYEEGTTAAPNDINDDIFTQGNVAIGKNTADYSLEVESNGTRGINTLMNGTSNSDIYGHYINNTNTGTGKHYGLKTEISGESDIYGTHNTLSAESTSVNLYGNYNKFEGIINTNGFTYGMYNEFDNFPTGFKIGLQNQMTSSTSSIKTGVINNINGSIIAGMVNSLSTSDSGNIVGVSNFLNGNANTTIYGIKNSIGGTSYASAYGSYNIINPIYPGPQFGVYSEALRTTGTTFAGYFRGNLAVGTTGTGTGANYYIFPPSRGTNNQIMQTDGSGQLSWVTPTTGDITGVTAGNGLTGGGAGGNVTLDVVATNGLTTGVDNIVFGGNLTQTTTITQGTNNFTIDLTDTGDFQIDGNATNDILFADGGNNLVRFGSQNGNLFNNGAVVSGITIDYVVDFDNNGAGTTIGVGSAEYIADAGANRIMLQGTFLPTTDDNFDIGSSTQRWDDVYATSGVVNTSDIRLKKNISPLDYGLKEILKMKPISYQWKGKNNAETKLGFSAQELLQILPEVVKTHDVEISEKDGSIQTKPNEVLGVYYSDIIPVTVKAIQEQQIEINQLKKENEALKEKQKSLEERLQNIERIIKNKN